MSDARLEAKIAATKARLAALESAVQVPSADRARRKVGILLAAGVFFLPYVFAWLLLRRGYSRPARIIGLGWLTIILVAIVFGRPSETGANATKAATAPSPFVDPDADKKRQAAALARVLVPHALKDPESAKFGSVWGVTDQIACGFVNAKNGFGAMAGDRRFIFSGGAVEFEGAPHFASHWNHLCVEKQLSTPPSGALGLRWGAAPSAKLRRYQEPVDGLSLYVPKDAVQLEGVAAKQADATFDRGRLISADYYFAGEANRDAVLAAIVKKFGRPLDYDEAAGVYKWAWPAAHTTLAAYYKESGQSTTVTLAHGAH